jgi:single-stranded-DNA-specific exonuclease
MQNKWKLKPIADVAKVESLQQSLGVESIIAELLIERGIQTFDEAKSFFRPELKHLHDPFLMKDMHKAVERVEFALENKQKILVYGDYDVDGTTSVSLMVTFLESLGANLEYYIPDRYAEGYGVSYMGIDYAHLNNFSLIICLDCGIKAVDKIAYANEKNVDFIICDHHRPGDIVPAAVAVLDPKQNDCNYPYKELSGCGVGFKLAQAYSLHKNLAFENLLPLLDLLVISIAADIVPITGENRLMAYYGLQQLNSNPRIGVKALLDIAGKDKQVTISDVVFGLAPRINAAGRIEHGKKAVELLIQKDVVQAKEKAQYINEHNLTRRDLDQQITKEALQLIVPNAKSTVVFKSDWHKGVIGIVASRLIESYYRPTIVLTENNGMLTGSARSVIGFDVYDAIDACSDLLEQFGGHKYAAGLSLKKENLNAFVAQFEKVVSSTITEEMLAPEIRIDAELPIDKVDKKLLRILSQMEPFGPGNNRPVFLSKEVKDVGYGRLIGADKTHLKLNLTSEDSAKKFDAIGFSMSDKFDFIKGGKSFDICYVLEENVWNGKSNLQLRLKDLRPLS